MTEKSTQRKKYEVLRDQLQDEIVDRFRYGQEMWGDEWEDAHPEFLLERLSDNLESFLVRDIEDSDDVFESLEDLSDINNFAMMYLVRQDAIDEEELAKKAREAKEADEDEFTELDDSGSFDYGERLSDGQYENHPTIDEGEFVQPVRNLYVHVDGSCDNAVTRMSPKLAKSFARDPSFYSESFCFECKDYFPLNEFMWKDTDIRMDEEGK